MDRLHRDGVVPGFFYYPLDGVDQKEILDLRDQLEQAIGAPAKTSTAVSSRVFRSQAMKSR